MILDTPYLLPLARIEIDTDLLREIAEGKTKIRFEDITISQISIFELQAKAAGLGIPPHYVIEAVEVIEKAFRIEPFNRPQIIETSFNLRKEINDYIDCIILATAITLKEDLITEDTTILKQKQNIKKKYNIDVLNYKTIIG